MRRVREILRLKHECGASDRAIGRSLGIAQALNRERVRGPQGGAWGPSTIAGNAARGTGILNNELYLADSDETGRAFQSEAGHLFRDEAGRRSDLKPATWAAVPGSMVMVDAIAPTVKPAWSAGWSSAACAGSRR